MDEQRKQWDDVAAGWEKWTPFIERSAQCVSDALIERACIQPGHTVLDVATGPGEPALSAARIVGDGGRVIATDHAPSMIAVAKKRAAASGLQNVETRVTKGETFDLPDDSVDAVICRWGLMFFHEPSKQLTDIRRVLKPAGRFAAAVWAAPPKVPMLSAPMMALGKALGLPPPPPGPSPFALADASKFEQLLRGVGFGDVQIEEQTIDFTYDSMDQYMESLVDLAAPITALLAAHSARRDELLSVVRDAMKRFARDDGAIVLPNTVIYACAES